MTELLAIVIIAYGIGIATGYGVERWVIYRSHMRALDRVTRDLSPGLHPGDLFEAVNVARPTSSS